MTSRWPRAPPLRALAVNIVAELQHKQRRWGSHQEASSRQDFLTPVAMELSAGIEIDANFARSVEEA